MTGHQDILFRMLIQLTDIPGLGMMCDSLGRFALQKFQ